MATNDHPTIDLEGLIRGFLEDLRIIGTPHAERGGQVPNNGLSQLRVVAEHLHGQQALATEEVNRRYRGRSEEMQAVLLQREQRLEAYAERERQVVPPSPDRFVVAGRVTDRQTGMGLPHVRVRATDLDRVEHEILGYVRTDALGYYRIEYTAADFVERDENPETFIEVLDDANNILFTSSKSFVQKAGQTAFIPAEVDGDLLPASRRVAEKIAATVDKRHEDLALRQRVLASRPDVVLNLGADARSARAIGIVPLTMPERGIEEPAPGPRVETTAARPLTDVTGIGRAFSERLAAAGIREIATLARTPPARVGGILNVSEDRAAAMVADARERTRRPR